MRYTSRVWITNQIVSNIDKFWYIKLNHYIPLSLVPLQCQWWNLEDFNFPLTKECEFFSPSVKEAELLSNSRRMWNFTGFEIRVGNSRSLHENPCSASSIGSNHWLIDIGVHAKVQTLYGMKLKFVQGLLLLFLDKSLLQNMCHTWRDASKLSLKWILYHGLQTLFKRSLRFVRISFNCWCVKS